MAIVKMKKFKLFALEKDRKPLLKNYRNLIMCILLKPQMKKMKI